MATLSSSDLKDFAIGMMCHDCGGVDFGIIPWHLGRPKLPDDTGKMKNN